MVEPGQLHYFHAFSHMYSHAPVEPVFELVPFQEKGNGHLALQFCPSPERQGHIPPVHCIRLVRRTETGKGVMPPHGRQKTIETVFPFLCCRIQSSDIHTLSSGCFADENGVF